MKRSRGKSALLVNLKKVQLAVIWIGAPSCLRFVVVSTLVAFFLMKDHRLFINFPIYSYHRFHSRHRLLLVVILCSFMAYHPIIIRSSG